MSHKGYSQNQQHSNSNPNFNPKPNPTLGSTENVMDYRGYSQNQQRQSMNNQFNYNNSFAENSTLIPLENFSNPNNTIHNNLNQNVFNENIMDYSLHIDSGDRNTTVFPNPFKFVVSLGGAGTSTSSTFNPQTQTFVTNTFTGVPSPRIEKNFKNIKYVCIDKFFFPKNIVYDVSNNVYTGISALSHKYRYLIVRIKELENNKLLSTNINVRDDSFIIYRDKDLGGCNAEIWIAAQPKRTYLKSALKNLDKLSIEIIDNNGNQIQYTYMHNGTEIPIPLSELTNPATTNNYQISMQVTLGIFENDLNTNVNYT